MIHAHRRATAHSALASTGILNLKPGSTNTIPGEVRFSLDIRSPRYETVTDLEAELKRDFAAIAAGEDLGGLHSGGTPGRNEAFEVSWTEDSNTAATVFHEDCVQCVREAAEQTLGSKDLFRDMTSGAGHDSVFANWHCPTSMIFIPGRDGVSHNPAEYSTPEDCALGAQVLMQSVLKYDQLRARG
jgi:acetylornithine deacetylase/succinyl-diaminopimelate desuccinylase-like protein